MNGSLMLAVLVATLSIGDATMPPEVKSLVEAERAFAKMSVDVSMRDAFLANLGDGAVVFNPGPVDGRALYESRPASDVLLSWEPEYAEVSDGGDIGFTTGPWEFRPDRGAEPVAFGHFVSIWSRQEDGQWKVELDVGIEHARQEEKPALSYRISRGAPQVRGTSEEAIVTLEDKHFAEAAAANPAAAYRAYGAKDIRLYRRGYPPVSGIDDACNLAAADTVRDVIVAKASSGTHRDFCYTVGSIGSPVAAWYLRIWRLDANGQWKIVLDLLSPVPAGEED